MNPWVDAATGIALVLVVVRCLGPSDWKDPARWRLPDLGGFFFIFVGANAFAGAIKIGRHLALGHVVIASGGGPVSLDTEDTVILLGGVIAAAIVGLISIRDGLARLVV